MEAGSAVAVTVLLALVMAHGVVVDVHGSTVSIGQDTPWCVVRKKEVFENV